MPRRPNTQNAHPRAQHAQEAGIKTADAVVLVPPIRDMERWCARQGHHKVTSRIREADAMVMAGLIQVRIEGSGRHCGDAGSPALDQL